MRMRISGWLAAIGFAGVLLSPAAYAQTTTTQESVGDRSASYSDDSNSASVRGALLDKVRNDYGPFGVEDGRFKGGREYELSGARGDFDASTDALGGIDCTGNGRLLAVDGGVTADVGLPQFSSDFGGDRTSSTDSGDSSRRNSRRKKAAKAARLFGDCSASVEASLVQVNADCETAVGTFDVQGDGPSANAECGCSGCEVGAALVWVEGEWTSPTIGGCGIEGNVIAGLEGGVGGKLGAGTAGTVGGKLKVGPIGGKLGVDITRFDGAAALDCLENAADTVVNAARDLGNGLVSLFNRVRPRFDNPLPGIRLPSGGGAASGWVRP